MKLDGALRRRGAAFGLGLALVLLYWLSVRPPNLEKIGYFADLCNVDIWRQIMAENFRQFGRPNFTTQSFMAPSGASVPFTAWSIERDGIGALAWLINPQFPYFWVYYGVSLLASYVWSGYFLRKMELSRLAAWGLAALVVINNLPRHYKTYHHSDFLGAHWVYGSLFLDAWIWQRFERQKKVSLHLEAWRGVFLVGMMGSNGYYWGPLVLEWLLVRAGLVIGYFRGSVKTEGLRRATILPLALITFLSAACLLWFLPLVKEMALYGKIFQPVAWHAHLSRILEPLWWDHLVNLVLLAVPALARPLSFHHPETVVTVGWLYWAPVIAGTVLLWKKRELRRTAPFLILMLLMCLYVINDNNLFCGVVQKIIPFMKYFRVATRMGLLFPAVLGTLIALMWTEISEWSGKLRKPVRTIFILLSLSELLWLTTPINAMPALDTSTASILTHIKNTPGDTVLDLPFCSAGGNGVCTAEQCPHYPYSTVGQCFRQIHEKKVYGLYQARMTEAHCDLYRKTPYTRWFAAWREDRCLQGSEWTEFCHFLGEQRGLSAVLLYPEIWKAAATPSCQREFKAHLGAPLETGNFLLGDASEQYRAHPTTLQRYGTRCVSP